MSKQSAASWLDHKGSVILLANSSKQNFILELPTGRYRLDAGRKMRTTRSILEIEQVQQLVDGGQLVVESSARR